MYTEKFKYVLADLWYDSDVEKSQQRSKRLCNFFRFQNIKNRFKKNINGGFYYESKCKKGWLL